MLHVEVQNVGRGTKPHILASCRVRFTSEDEKDAVTIFDVRVLRNNSGELWVGYPSQTVKAFDGTVKYMPLIELSRDLHFRVTKAVLDEYEMVMGARTRGENYGEVRMSNIRMQNDPRGGNDGR